MVGGKLFYVHPLYLFAYMSAIAGQTAGPNGLTFFWGNPWVPGKKFEFFFQKSIFLVKKKRFPRATSGTLLLSLFDLCVWNKHHVSREKFKWKNVDMSVFIWICHIERIELKYPDLRSCRRFIQNIFNDKLNLHLYQSSKN